MLYLIRLSHQPFIFHIATTFNKKLIKYLDSGKFKGSLKGFLWGGFLSL